jgi:predicted CopG family antitoxin
MADRKNIKLDPDMYDRLRKAKHEYETWNHFFDRLLKEAGADE